MEKDIPCKEGCKDVKAAVAILTSNEIDFKTKKVTRDKEGHYIMIWDHSNRRILTSITSMHPP